MWTPSGAPWPALHRGRRGVPAEREWDRILFVAVQCRQPPRAGARTAPTETAGCSAHTSPVATVTPFAVAGHRLQVHEQHCRICLALTLRCSHVSNTKPCRPPLPCIPRGTPKTLPRSRDLVVFHCCSPPGITAGCAPPPAVIGLVHLWIVRWYHDPVSMHEIHAGGLLLHNLLASRYLFTCSSIWLAAMSFGRVA